VSTIISYTEKEKKKLLSMLPSSYMEWHRDVSPIYSTVGYAVGFNVGVTTKTNKYYVYSKNPYRIITENLLTELLNDTKDNSDIFGVGAENLIEVKNFLYDTPLEDVPLYIEEYPEMVKFRLDIRR
jgi:hypothetical protein